MQTVQYRSVHMECPDVAPARPVTGRVRATLRRREAAALTRMSGRREALTHACINTAMVVWTRISRIVTANIGWRHPLDWLFVYACRPIKFWAALLSTLLPLQPNQTSRLQLRQPKCCVTHRTELKTACFFRSGPSSFWPGPTQPVVYTRFLI